jgi:hypothetical protein
MSAGRIRLRTAAASGILLGFAISVKFLGLHFLLFSGLFLVWQLLRERTSLARAIKVVAVFTTACVLVGGFWYVKNLRNFDNPVYPMYSSPGFDEGIGLFMLDRRPTNMVIFPFYRWGVQWFQHPEKESSSDLVVFGYLLLMYSLAAASLFFKKKKWRFIEIVLFVFVQGYLWIMFYSSHQARFLVPAIMILPAFSALIADSLFTRLLDNQSKSTERKVVRISGAIAFAVFVILFAGNIHYFDVRFDYIRGALTKSAYILKVGSQ